MASAIPHFPDAQRAQLLRAYAMQSAERRWRNLLGLAILSLCILAAGYVGEVDPKKLFDNLGNFTNYIVRLFYLDDGQNVFAHPYEWFWGLTQKNKWLPLLGETLMIAYLGTVIGASTAFLCSFVAAQNLVKSRWITFAVRRLLEFFRTVPELVFALIFVVAFGLGPLPGVLALAIHSTGALGKLLAEVVENIDMKPVEGVSSTGASWIQTVRFAVAPQILSNFVSYALLRFEVNVRDAGVMGFIGAGEIGQELLVSVRKFYYSDVSAILILLVTTVMVIDFLTEQLRHRLIGLGGCAMSKILAPGERARIEGRYPDLFRVNWHARSRVILVVLAPIALLLFGFLTLDISWHRVALGFGRLGQFAALMFPPTFGSYEKLQIYLMSLAQTLAIAFLGTLLAAILALPLGLLAARNVIPNVFAHFAIRRSLDILRAVDTLIWALIWINVVGLGPFAGILAIATSDLGSFGKLFSEAIEAADKKPIEGILASGGASIHAVRFGILPR